MKTLALFLLLTITSFAQSSISPISNPIGFNRIDDAVVYRDTLFLTAGNQLWAYNGSSFLLKKSFSREVKSLLVDQNKLYVFYQKSHLGQIAQVYNGTWKMQYASYSGAVYIYKVITFSNLFYGACRAYTSTLTPYNGFSWNGDSSLITIFGYGTSKFCYPSAVSISQQNGQLVLSGYSDDCNESIETIAGPYSNFNGGLASSFQYNFSRLVMHEWYKGKMYAYGVFDTANGISLNNNAVWNEDSTTWTRFNHPVFDSADYLLSMSTCDHLMFAFPGFNNGNGTTIRVMFKNDNGWNLTSYKFYSPKTYAPSSIIQYGFNLDSIYQLKTITYQGTVYLYGDIFVMDGYQVFNKIGKMPTFIGIDNNPIKPQFALYPNPTKGLLKLKGDTEKGSFVIYNMRGAKMLAGFALPQIDVGMLPSGIYIFELQQNGIVYRQRFVKTN